LGGGFGNIFCTLSGWDKEERIKYVGFLPRGKVWCKILLSCVVHSYRLLISLEEYFER